MIGKHTAKPQEDLELMAPGPELAAVLDSVDRRLLSDRDRVRLMQSRNRLVAHLQAQLFAPECKRDHTFKHHPGTELTHFGDGTFGWTTPKGMQHTNRADPPLYLDTNLINPHPPDQPPPTDAPHLPADPCLPDDW